MSRKALDWPNKSRQFVQQNKPLRSSTFNYSPPLKKRCFGSSSGGFSSSPSPNRQHNRPPTETSHFDEQLGQRAREKLANKDFFFSLLSSASTKREAKSYLSRFKSHKPSLRSAREFPKARPQRQTATEDVSHPGVNLGGIFETTRAAEESPVFRQESTPEISQTTDSVSDKLHVALVKIREPQSLDDQTLLGVAGTLLQLTTLGMGCCVVVDPGLTEKDESWRSRVMEQADRLCGAIDAISGSGSRRLDSVITVPSSSSDALSVLSRKVLLSPLRRGRILVTVPIAYTQDTQRAVALSANDAVLALAKEFAGLDTKTNPDENPLEASQRLNKLQDQVSLDRLIILDPVGGIPALRRRLQNSHVFVNLEQEYSDIVDELTQGIESTPYQSLIGPPLYGKGSPTPLGNNQAISKFMETETTAPSRVSQQTKVVDAADGATTLERHLSNLKLLQQTLSQLPPSSSGIITTPQDAANSATTPRDQSQFSAVGTRRQRNPLLHNLLTDKPVYSASLPLSRLGVTANDPSGTVAPTSHSTFVKKGMPLTIFPDPRIKSWKSTDLKSQRLSLKDPQIDLPRLVHLIDDSFNRKLDVQHYLNRINDRLAGLIIAGEYEGGAILTWELPPGVPDDGSDESISRMVPYLDKFAVLKRSQGAGGVADIVFNAMVRTCFPKGVCWRSRGDNPVNKWYFERARGTWKLPDTNWTMFWTTDGVPENYQLFRDYEGVCRNVEPSWADNKKEVD